MRKISIFRISVEKLKLPHNILLTFIYTLTGFLGISFDTIAGLACPIWPPSAVALLAIFFFGRSMWLGTFLGAFIINGYLGASIAGNFGASFGALLEAVIGSYLLHKLRFRPSLSRTRDTLMLILCNCFVGSFISAVVGVSSLVLTGDIAPSALKQSIGIWWLGDAVAIIAFAPIGFISMSRNWQTSWSWIKRADFLLYAGAFVFLSYHIFSQFCADPHNEGQFVRPYLLLPLMMLFVSRFGAIGAAAAAALVSATGIFSLHNCLTPFSHDHAIDRMIAIQGFVAVAAITGLMLSSTLAQLRRALEILAFKRRNLLESEAHFRACFELSGVAHAEVDLKTRRFYQVNRKFCDLLGYTAAEMKSRPFTDFTHPEDRQGTLQRLQALISGDLREASVEKRYVKKDGSCIWGHVTATIIRSPSGIPLRAIAVIQDLTERKIADDKLRAAKEAAEHANRAKSLFLANMSHEIRTPLNAILGFMHFLSDPSQSSEERAACLATIRRNGESLVRIIDDILDLSRVEAGKLEIEKISFSLADLLQDSILLLQKTAEGKGLVLRTKSYGRLPHMIFSDPTRIRQTLYNVVGNAVKFTKQGFVDVTAVAQATSENTVKLQFIIQDTGPGISPRKVGRLFEPYLQGEVSTSRLYGGSGLGLFVAKNLAQALGGDVLLRETASGIGTTFDVSFHVEVEPSKGGFEWDARLMRQRDQAITLEDGKKKKPLEGVSILVVDDARDNQLVVGRILELAGANVELAACGNAGLEKALNKFYDVLLLDIQMPDLDGNEVVAKLRSLGYERPVIALTAHVLNSEKEAALKYGFDDFLTKPVVVDKLLTTVGRWTAKAAAV